MTKNLSNKTLDYLLEGFQLISYDWRYLYVNDAVVKQSKNTRVNLIGYTMMEKYPGIENTEMFRILKRCMHERTSEQMENFFIYPDNTVAWFELHIQPVPEGIFILSIDISKRKEAEIELLKLNEKLEDMVAIRTSQLERKNKDILDSLNYAKNIQKAFLPKKTDLFNLFPNSLIIYKPKDIVSGDFYWYKDYSDRVILAAADCTGHGVPGALMSIICIEKLNNVILKSRHPSEILEKLNRSIKIALKQSDINVRNNDGMDIAVCSIDKKNRTVLFAGANRPLWIIRKGHTSIEEIKATKKAIGGHTEDSQHFASHKIKLQAGDIFYIFSDGYADTFNGKNKKMTTKKFKEVLWCMRNKDMSEQKKHLENFIERWKGEMEQVDDILVIGIEL